MENNSKNQDASFEEMNEKYFKVYDLLPKNNAKESYADLMELVSELPSAEEAAKIFDGFGQNVPAPISDELLGQVSGTINHVTTQLSMVLELLEKLASYSDTDKTDSQTEETT